MKKYLIVFLLIFFLILTFLLIYFSREKIFTQKTENPKPEINTTATPYPSGGSFNTLLKQSTLKKLQTLPPLSTANVAVFYSPELQKMVILLKTDQAATDLQQWAKDNNLLTLIKNPDYFTTIDLATKKTLSDQEKAILAKLRSTGYEDNNIAIYYNENLQTFVVDKKKANSNAAVTQWAKDNQLDELIKDPNIFVQHQIDPAVPTPTRIPLPTSIPRITDTTSETYKKLNQKYVDYFHTALDLFARINGSSETSPSLPPDIGPSSLPPPPTTDDATYNPFNTGLALKAIIQEAGEKVEVPWRILEAFIRTETATNSLPDDKILEYSQPGNHAPYSQCYINSCGAWGIVQILRGYRLNYTSQEDISTNRDYNCLKCNPGVNRCPGNNLDVWNGQLPRLGIKLKDSVKIYGGSTAEPNPCNYRDIIFATAAHLKNSSGATDPNTWTYDQVKNAVCNYYGWGKDGNGNYKCTTTRYAHINNKTYVGFVWDHYQNSLNNQGYIANNLSPIPILASNSIQQLVDNIRANCTYAGAIGRVTYYNRSCLNQGVINNDTRKYINCELTKMMNNKESNFQCVGFVKGTDVELYKTSPDKLCGSYGNAKDLSLSDYRPVTRTDVDTVQVGYLPRWSFGRYGHVAYVMEVYSPTRFKVAEANWGKRGLVQTRIVVLDNNPDNPVNNIKDWLVKNFQ